MQGKLRWSMILLVVVLFVGVIGYQYFMDLSWIDALYMTVITITTVGYKEVGVPTTTAKLFTVLFILISVVVVGYALSAITEYLLSNNSLADLRLKRKGKQFKSMENHIIVCGYGRNGRQAVRKLQDYKKDFIIIEKNQDVIDNAAIDQKHFLKGNASDDDVLVNAGVNRASTLITALPEDADNLFIVLSARQLNKSLKIISRASEDTSDKKLKLAGADNVILPDTIGGQHMASLIVSPDLIEFWDNLSYGGSNGVNLEQISFEQIFDHQKKDCSILELNLRQQTGCNIIGYKSPDGDYTVNPDPSLRLLPGSKIIVIGNAKQIAKLQKIYRINDAVT